MSYPRRPQGPEQGRKSPSLFRVTPIPDVLPPTGRISATPSVSSIPEGDEEEPSSFSPQESKLVERKGSSKRLPLVAEALEKIDEMSVSRSGGLDGLEDLRGYRAPQSFTPRDQGSRSGSPSPSDISDASGRGSRSVNLFRPTPIPNEAAGSLSGQSSFSSIKRNGNYRRTPTITEDEELDEGKDVRRSLSVLSDRQDSLKSTGSLHRPTPIPKDLPQTSSRSLARGSANLPKTPTIHEDETESASGGESRSGGESDGRSTRSRKGRMAHLRSKPPPLADKFEALKRSPPSSFTASPALARVVEGAGNPEVGRDPAANGIPLSNGLQGEPVRTVHGFPGDQSGSPATELFPRVREQATNLTAVSLQEKDRANQERPYDSVSSYNNQPIRPAFKMGTVSEGAKPQLTADGKTQHARGASLGQVSGSFTPQSGASAGSYAPFVDNKDNERDMLGVARFLRMTPGLSRQLIGELLGENNERCIKVLEIFTSTFDFKGLSFEVALREYLESFRLPGESQKILRILEAWSQQFYQQCGPGVFKSSDATVHMAFSVVLLNTDLHNHQVRQKMTKEEFVRNNRGLNEGSDFPTEFLETLYSSVQKRALKMPPAYGQMGRTSTLPEAALKTQQQYQSPKAKRSSFLCFGA